jgi:hypothetical protein
MDPDPLRDKADHTLAVPAAITNPTHQLPPESNSEGNREVFMVGEGEQAPEKTVEEIAHEGEEGIARVARLTKMGKRHNGL